MGELIDIEEGVRAKSSEHESGALMIVFETFSPKVLDRETVARLMEMAREKLAPNADIVRICLGADQEKEKFLLVSAGFSTDGYEFEISKSMLKHGLLSEGLKVRTMSFEQDIDAVTELEKTVHAADVTSRVDFETSEAIASMRSYYQRTCASKGVYVLTQNSMIVGVAGFMPDRKRDGAVHISSVSIDLDLQGQSLFFPFLGTCLAHDYFDAFRTITGVTTTERLIAAAKKYGASLLGWSLSRRIESHRT